jgi:VWFA-related protein
MTLPGEHTPSRWRRGRGLGWRAYALGSVTLSIAVTVLQAQERRTPEYTSRVEGVRLDVRVVAADGTFVRVLRKEDFHVLEDGQEQSITNLALVDLGSAAPPAAAGAAPTDVASNASFVGGRIYLLVLDDLHVNELREVTVRSIARRFIEQYTSANDRVAIATTSGSYAGTQEFTNDRLRLAEAVNHFRARDLPESAPTTVIGFNPGMFGGPAAPPPANIASRKEVVTLQCLLSAVEWLASVPDRRKSIVFVSEGFPSIDGDARFELRDVVSVAARSSVAIYSVDAHGLPSGRRGAITPVAVPDDHLLDDAARRADDPLDRSRFDREQTLAELSESTGGASVIASNAFDELFQRIVADNTVYYLLGYNSSLADSKKPRRLKVTVDRPGVTVQVRTSAGSLPTRRAAKRAAPPAGIPRALGEVLQSPVPITDLGLTVTAIPRRAKGARAAVGIVVEARGTKATDVAIVVAKVGGKVSDFKRGVLRPAEDASGASVLRSTTTTELSPGRYHLRVAALDPMTGARGSVLHDFDVPDFSKESVSIGGLTLWEVRPTRVVALRRTFTPSEAVDVSAEIYWKRNDTTPIAVAISVVNDRQEVVFRQERSVEGDQQARLGLESVARLDFNRFPPGNYIVRVAAERAGKRPWSAKRETAVTLTGER